MDRKRTDREPMADRPAIQNGRSTIPSSLNAQKRLLSGAELRDLKFPETLYLIAGLLPSGATLLVGPEKVGKTLWGMELAWSCALGRNAFGNFKVGQGEVLYVLGEGNLRDFQDRSKLMLAGMDWTDQISILTPSFGQKISVEEIRDWASQYRRQLIVIDTLLAVHPPRNERKNSYEKYYEVVSELARISDDFGVSVLIIHHTKREKAESPFDLVSGGRGPGAAVDNIAVMEKNPKGEVLLHLRGRNIQDKKTVFDLNTDSLRWMHLGDTKHLEKSPPRQVIYNFLRQNAGKSFSPKEISDEYVEPSYDSIRKLLPKMARDVDSLVLQDDSGKYYVRSEGA